MNCKNILRVSAAAAALLASALAAAQQPPKPEQIIKWRQAAYQVLGWNAGRIRASIEGTYDREQVQKSAELIAALANADLGKLYPAGTETGSGFHETRAKPEIFTDKKVAELAQNFSREANELAKVAATGDATAVKTQFGKLGKTCKACHDDYRNKD